MKSEVLEIRNLKGTLLCKVAFEDDRWQVRFKNHGCYTHLELQQDGKMELANYEEAQL